MDNQPVIPVESSPAARVDEPRSFMELPALWLQLPHMDESFFAAEMPHASNVNTFLSVLVYALVATVCVVLTSLARIVLGSAQEASSAGFAAAVGGCVGLIGGPLAFYINTGIYYVSAMIFGGKGTFSRQAYVHSLYFVPLSVISSLATFLQLIPVAGIPLSILVLLIVTIAVLVLQVRAFKVVHSFSTGRAAAAVLVPFGLVMSLACLAIGLGVALMVMGPAIGSVFSSINQSLP